MSWTSDHSDFVLTFFCADYPSSDVLESMADLTPEIFALWHKAGEATALSMNGRIYEHEATLGVFRAERFEHFRQLLLNEQYIRLGDEVDRDLIDMEEIYMDGVDLNLFHDIPKGIL